MLKISEDTMKSLHEEGLEGLEARILEHWQKDLKESGQMAGSDGRAEAIEAVKNISRDDPSVSDGDLMMMADLMLVQIANEKRTVMQKNGRDM